MQAIQDRLNLLVIGIKSMDLLLEMRKLIFESLLNLKCGSIQLRMMTEGVMLHVPLYHLGMLYRLVRELRKLGTDETRLLGHLDLAQEI